MTNPPADWYPDPTHRHQLRYWDGSQWTEHVATDGVQATDPLSSGPESSGTAAGDSAGEAVGGGAAETAALVPAGRTQAAEPAEPAEHMPGLFARMREEHRQKAAGREEFEALATRAAGGDEQALAALPAAVAEARSLFRAGQLQEKLWGTMTVAVRDVISDDVLSEQEEQRLVRLGEILGTPVQAIEHRDHALFEELVIAGINDGRFPRDPDPSVMLRRGEAAYGSFDASLMKEQAVREFRGGTQSVSIPLGHGFRYRVGGVRGRSVVVGSQMVVQDSGSLHVTSQRVLFTGQAKTLEFRNDRMVGLEQYADGLRLSVSNRQTASLFKLESPSIVAALITASVAHSN